MLGTLGFENAYALAMTRTKARRFGIRSIADLAVRASELTIAGDYEFFARPEWDALRKSYGLRFKRNARCSRSSCTELSPAARSM